MPCPKLSPLQARFAASLAATVFVALLYLLFTSPHLAYAVDVDSILRGDHNHPVSLELFIPVDPNELDFLDSTPVSEYTAQEHLDGSDIVQRAPAGIDALANNAPGLKNIRIGETQHWVFPKEAVAGPKSPSTPGLPAGVGRRSEIQATNNDALDDLERRDDDTPLATRATTKVHITANTCLQPSLNTTQQAKDAGPPQLRLYISQTEEKPGPDTVGSGVVVFDFQGGYAVADLNADGDVYLGVSAPNNTRYAGVYNYEIAASIDGPFHRYDSGSPFLYFVDGDNGAALLQTDDTTQAQPDDEAYKQWMSLDPPPYTMFAHNMNDSKIMGLERSYCGLSKNAQIRKNGDNVDMGMTNRGLNHKPKEQFYVKGLNRSSTYYGFLAMEGNSTNSGNGVVGGGGKVWRAMNFTTKTGDNCAVLYDLEFCSEVAYAVPSNPGIRIADLKSMYDDHAADVFKNFSRSLQQIPCNAANNAQYSLARNCTHCEAAYKQWLCAVTIPRCQDYSSTLGFLQPRNVAQKFINGSTLDINNDPSLQFAVVNNSSRNPLIDEMIKPGPYKEVLPCQDLCFELAQSCPSALGFGCPEGKWLNASYGRRSANGDITCSYLGAAYFLNAAWRSAVGSPQVILGGVLGGFVVLWTVSL
ncbi:hypothetical protein AJ80_02728 [Polytolypa hystricis UAMH7299]|uniref:FZ domain-containing protein n=1 Tax=Polytolypa hystricis (strain UAMH7299) TaxID=1447883 RepID=A0A2B7YQN5_POLH7|nr:hypothetical protein AJ80_02728 [Polytolypa hystricis UAMH7299]